jgi:hypothetical protein
MSADIATTYAAGRLSARAKSRPCVPGAAQHDARLRGKMRCRPGTLSKEVAAHAAPPAAPLCTCSAGATSRRSISLHPKLTIPSRFCVAGPSLA